MANNIVKGMTLYSLNVGNAARGKEQKLTPYIVTKVGSKYFYIRTTDLDSWSEATFRLDDLQEKTNYMSGHSLYFTKQEYFDEKEIRGLTLKIREAFDNFRVSHKFSLNQLRRINEIISE